MHKGIAVAALALTLGVTQTLGSQDTAKRNVVGSTTPSNNRATIPASKPSSSADSNTVSAQVEKEGRSLTKNLLPWIQGLGIPALLLAWLNRGGKGLPGVKKRRSPKELDVLSSANYSEVTETDPELKQLILEARHALVFETTFGVRAEAGCRAALTEFWRERNGRFTMPEIGQAATHVRWDCGEFTYRGLIARRERERLGRLRRWLRYHFWVIPIIALLFLEWFFLYDMLDDYRKNGGVFDLLDVGVACYIALASVLCDLWLRKLEVVDDLVEWSRVRAKANSADAAHSAILQPDSRQRAQLLPDIVP